MIKEVSAKNGDASKDALGDRMKQYEAVEADRKLEPGLPIYVRLDGRAFSTFTRGLQKPYDRRLSWIMAQTAITLMGKARPQIAYTQSDEISLGWFAKEEMAEFLFGGRTQKLTSVLAGMASARFNQLCYEMGGTYAERAERYVPHFDARVYQVPTEMELMNSFVWREQDCARNAVSMAAQAMIPHKMLQGVKTQEMKSLLALQGVNFDEDYPSFFKHGSYFRKELREYPLPDSAPAEFRNENETMLRSRIIRVKNPEWDTTLDRLLYFK